MTHEDVLACLSLDQSQKNNERKAIAIAKATFSSGLDVEKLSITSLGQNWGSSDWIIVLKASVNRETHNKIDYDNLLNEDAIKKWEVYTYNSVNYTYEDEKYEDKKYKDKGHGIHTYEDDKNEAKRQGDKRYEDQIYEDNRYENLRYENYRYEHYTYEDNRYEDSRY